MQDKMEFLKKNLVMKIISSMKEIVRAINSLIECVKKENVDMISDIKDLGEETNYSISDLKVDISTSEKKS